METSTQIIPFSFSSKTVALVTSYQLLQYNYVLIGNLLTVT